MAWSIDYGVPAPIVGNVGLAPNAGAAAFAGSAPIVSVNTVASTLIQPNAGALNASGAAPNAVASGGTGFLLGGHWVPANQTLQLIYPLIDSVTSANSRHRWAYFDGTNVIQYQIPIVALGGSYPYVFTLDSASTALGMTIGQGFGSTNYGVLTWSPSGSVSGHTVTVTITDQQLNSVQAVFTISTSSAISHFVFLDALSGSDTSGSGTFGSPWQTLQKAFGATYQAKGVLGAGAICYLKPTATYPTAGVKYTDSTDINASPWFEMNTTTKPVALIGLGGQAVLDWTSGVFALALGDNAQDFFIASLNPTGVSTSVPNAKFVTIVGGGQVRFTSFNTIWTNSGYGGSGTDVSAPYTAPDLGGSNFRSNIAIVGFSETNRQSGQPGNNYCGHTFYSSQNWVSDGFTINMPSGSFDSVCYAKGTNQNYEMRNHFINVANAGTGGCCSNGFQPANEPASTNGEVRYCYIGSNVTLTNQKIGTQAGSYGSFFMNRNTLIGQFENAFGGTGLYQNNVVQTSGTPIPTGTGDTASGNVTATSGIINSTTLQLQGSAAGSVGTVGAQIA